MNDFIITAIIAITYVIIEIVVKEEVIKKADKILDLIEDICDNQTKVDIEFAEEINKLKHETKELKKNQETMKVMEAIITKGNYPESTEGNHIPHID